jgi:hypothetical protein
MTYNYKRLAERNSHTHRVQTDCGLSGVAHWTAIYLPHICLESRRLQWSSAKYDVTHLNSNGRHQGRTNTACQVGRATELGTIAPTVCGSWVSNLVHVTHLAPLNFQVAPTFMENLCTCGLDCWQKGCWTGSFEGLNRSHRLCEL